MQKSYRVIREHLGDRHFKEGDVRIGEEADLKHLVGRCLTPMSDAEAEAHAAKLVPAAGKSVAELLAEGKTSQDPDVQAAIAREEEAMPPGALRLHGPTISEWVKAGYLASKYPPRGYASRSTEAEIATAIEAETNSGAKSENAPLNKAESAPANKATNGRKTKTGDDASP